MCFVHGLADGKLLINEDFLKPEHVVDVQCTCGHEHGQGATRRQALSRGALGAGAAVLGSTFLGKAVLPGKASAATGPTSGDRLVTLGVNGGPVLNPTHAQSSTALHVTGHNSTTYLVDCGYEVAHQMVLDGNLPFKDLRHVFVTHHHSDHISGYAPLALHALFGNPPASAAAIRRLDYWGPHPMRQMQRDFNRSYALDIKSRVVGGSVDLSKLLHSHENDLPKRGVRKIMEDGNVIVHATLVKHGADMPGACAYRFTIKKTGRSIVFSGDTAPTKNLIDLAKDADTLVHECMSLPGVDLILTSADPASKPRLKKHLLTTHTVTADVVATAKQANVKRLILTHYVPVLIPASTFLADAKSAAGKIGFTGEILAANDLDSFAI